VARTPRFEILGLQSLILHAIGDKIVYLKANMKAATFSQTKYNVSHKSFDHLTIMRGKSVCLFVCLSAPS